MVRGGADLLSCTKRYGSARILSKADVSSNEVSQLLSYEKNKYK
jgi:hypothetical protein